MLRFQCLIGIDRIQPYINNTSHLIRNLTNFPFFNLNFTKLLRLNYHISWETYTLVISFFFFSFILFYCSMNKQNSVEKNIKNMHGRPSKNSSN